MTDLDHYNTYDRFYAGHPLANAFPPSDGDPVPDLSAVAWRFESNGWVEDVPEEISEGFDWFFDTVDTTKVEAIVIGEWKECYEDGSDPIVARLAESADRLPALRSLFLGAMSPEQCEISWIQQSDITPLLETYPKLERLEVRGGSGLRLRPVRHEALRVLRFETGGLPAEVVRGAGGCDLPALEQLELWFGVDEYGGDSTIGDCAEILSGERLSSLRYLALQNSPFADELAAGLAAAPVVARLESLSLSMGSLGDEGAEALLSGQPLTHLKQLDLRHHYMSLSMMNRVRTALPGVEVLLSESRSRDEDWRYVAVSE